MREQNLAVIKINLPNELREFIHGQVTVGLYPSIENVICDALRSFMSSRQDDRTDVEPLDLEALSRRSPVRRLNRRRTSTRKRAGTNATR